MLEVKQGTRIYLAGDSSDQIFLLKSGVIKISATTPDRREAILAFLTEGSERGPVALRSSKPVARRESGEAGLDSQALPPLRPPRAVASAPGIHACALQAVYG